jgi:hypothetical protein
LTGSVSTYRQVARVLLLFRHISDDVSPLSIDDLVVPHFSHEGWGPPNVAPQESLRGGSPLGILEENVNAIYDK